MRFGRNTILLAIALLATTEQPRASQRSSVDTKQGVARKLDRFLEEFERTAAATDLVPVIITTREDAMGRVKSAVEAYGATVDAIHPSISAVSVQVPAHRLRGLAARNDVIAVSTDAMVRAGADNVGTLADNMLLPTLGLTPSPAAGKDIGIAVIDSGVVNHEQLPVAAFYDFLRGGLKTKQFDDYGHGTHVAGMIRAKDDKSTARYRSIAGGARLIGLRVLGQDGSGPTSAVIAALEFAIANKARLKIDVINLSLGHPIYEPAATDPLVRAVERAVASGIVVVVAAGNMGLNPVTGEVGYAGITSPGNAPSAISVGAVDTKNTLTRTDDAVAPFSSRGPTWYDAYAKPDIVAPGRRVVSFMAKDSYLYRSYPSYYVNEATRTYMTLSGTSMAAAVTTGVVADMIAESRLANGGRTPTPNTIKAVLQYTAIPLDNADTLTQGAGSINAAGAVGLAKAIDTGAPVSSWWLRVGVTPTTTLTSGEVLAWGQQVLWNDEIIWGTHIYHNKPAWGLQTVWGNRNAWADEIIWGTTDDSVVWGTCGVWGDEIIWGTTTLGFNHYGTVVYGDSIDWRLVTPDRLVWGTVAGGSGATSTQYAPLWNPVF